MRGAWQRMYGARRRFVLRPSWPEASTVSARLVTLLLLGKVMAEALGLWVKAPTASAATLCAKWALSGGGYRFEKHRMTCKRVKAAD